LNALSNSNAIICPNPEKSMAKAIALTHFLIVLCPFEIQILYYGCLIGCAQKELVLDINPCDGSEPSQGLIDNIAE